MYYCPWCWSEVTVSATKVTIVDGATGRVEPHDELVSIRCPQHGVLYTVVPDELARMVTSGIVRTSIPNWVK